MHPSSSRFAVAIVVSAALVSSCGGPDESDSKDASSGSKSDLYQSGSRIKARMLVTADGAKSFLGWRDTQLGKNCTFALASDGKIRCLPRRNGNGGIGAQLRDIPKSIINKDTCCERNEEENMYVSYKYSDSNCATKIRFITSNRGKNAECQCIIFEKQSNPGMAPAEYSFEVYEAVSYTGSVYDGDSSSCQPSADVGSAYYINEEIDPSQFEEAIEQVE